jgi:hypothetical protein
MNQNSSEAFVKTTMAFFTANADIYARYCRFYWTTVQKNFLDKKPSAEEIKKFKDELTELKKGYNENKDINQNHLMRSNVNEITDVLTSINKYSPLVVVPR